MESCDASRSMPAVPVSMGVAAMRTVAGRAHVAADAMPQLDSVNSPTRRPPVTSLTARQTRRQPGRPPVTGRASAYRGNRPVPPIAVNLGGASMPASRLAIARAMSAIRMALVAPKRTCAWTPSAAPSIREIQACPVATTETAASVSRTDSGVLFAAVVRRMTSAGRPMVISAGTGASAQRDSPVLPACW
jgi:hypothetical protein